MSQALDLPVPPDAASDMVVATRPNAIRITGDQGFKTRVEKRIFLTDKTEYLVVWMDKKAQEERLKRQLV